ncbi:hypothetical protein LXA43DRAFT_987734 [Ganoderma leucocontextum]|nr:hypothetical protein LXA43DRAFT_987734 [Ganoderma leucocontextum]
MAAAQSSAPLLPVNISESPLLSGSSLLPDELFTTLAGPLPTITIGPCSPPSPHFEPKPKPFGASRPPRRKSNLLPKLALPPLASLTPSSAPSTPTTPVTPTTPPASRIPSKQVISLLDLLETMQNDVATEVQRVRLGIQETRMLVQACREDCAARESARQRRLRLKKERC